ncbi:MAG: aldo/keto reductase [Alphaproteobacteria bacterium]
MKRRQFMSSSLLMGAGLILSNSSLGNLAFANTAQAALNQRKIGDLSVHPIGLGCMSMVGVYNPRQPKDAMVRLIAQAVDNGVDFFDTAEVYGPHYSEEIVGEGLKPYRNRVKIASKFGFDFSGNRSSNRNASPSHVRTAVEGMLQRLQVETIDLCYLHRLDSDTPIEDTAGVVGELINEGKIRNFGLSEVSPEIIRRAHAVQPVAALQSEYSIVERVMEHDILPLCEELGIAFVPWGPLCRGMLSGRFDENYIPEAGYRRAGVPYFTPQALKTNLKMVDFLKELGQRKNATPAQIALGWLLAQKPFIIPIPGTTNPEHLMENIGAMNIQFSQAELIEIRQGIEDIKLIGFREPQSVFVNL